MADAEGTSPYEGRRTGGISLDFVRSPPGLVLVVNIVSDLTWIIHDQINDWNIILTCWEISKKYIFFEHGYVAFELLNKIFHF